MKTPTISIIIPVFNVKEYLNACITSVECQTFDAWELILVDDGSTDGSGEICDSYVNSRQSIVVYHIPNQGVSNARNFGVKKAKGEWITFIDGDDWVEPNYLKDLLQPIETNEGIDFVQGGCTNFFATDGYSINQKYDNYIGNDHEKLLKSFRGIVSSKLYKRNIINKYYIEHDCNMKVGEDWTFTLDYILHVEKYAFIDNTNYIYRRRVGSATMSKRIEDVNKNVDSFHHKYNSYVKYIERYDIPNNELNTRWKEMSNTLCQDVLRFMNRCSYSQLKDLSALPQLNLLIVNQPMIKKRMAFCVLRAIRGLNTIKRILRPTLRMKEIWTIILMLVSWCVAKVVRKEKELWLFCERGTDARDNGLWMFRYVKQNHPEINAKFIITTNSEDRKNVNKWKSSLVNSESFRHYVLMWQTKYFLSTHESGCLPVLIRKIRKLSKIVLKLNAKSRNIWLQHGITFHDMLSFHYDKMKHVDMVISGAQPEYEFLLNTFGFPKNRVQYTGLARFDGLHDFTINKKQILLMPTWRIWLNKNNFLTSEYFKTFRSFLSNNKLHQFLEDNGLTLIFYPHYEFQPFISEFKKDDLPSCIKIASKTHYDVQQLLKESALLITDHSSVFFDFAYMKKPIVLYQFDNQDFYKCHCGKGYLDDQNTFSYWADNEEDLIAIIMSSFRKGFLLEPLHRKLIEQFFPLHDANNCERIYNKTIKY